MALASSKTFTDAQILTLADEEITGNLMSVLTRFMEEYGVYTQDLDIVPGKAKYRFPYRAWMSKMRDIKYVDASGKEWFLARLEPDLAINNQNDQGQYPSGYTIESNSIILKPAPNAGVGKIRMRYYIRPNQLVAPAATGLVESIAGNTVTVGSAPGTFTGAINYDFIRSTPGFEHVFVDVKPTVFSSLGAGVYELTFDPSVDLSQLEVGDYCCIAGQSPAPQLPADMHTFLYQRVVCKIQELQGDAQARMAALQEQQMLEDHLKSMVPRVDSAKQIVQPYLRDHLI